MGKHSAEEQIVINGTAQECFDALIDYESFHEWQDAVNDVKILERDDEGRGKVVELTVDAKMKTIRYRLDYHYDEPNSVTWDFLEGDVKEIEGGYEIEEQGDGTTLIKHELQIDPGVWVPGRIARTLNEQVLQRSLKDLKDRVEGLTAKTAAS